MKFHTVESLGDVQHLTREGFLVCVGVPIARIGTLIYANGEIVASDPSEALRPGPDGLIRVTREPEDVFDAEAMASFVGKPVTIDHPFEDVTPDNWQELAVGSAQHIRRGKGILSDLLIADLIITRKDGIAAIRNKTHREVSNGYDAQYVQTEPGFARQIMIRGNHIALVPRGRCGPVCSIGDAEPMTTKIEPKVIREPMARISTRATAFDRFGRLARRLTRARAADADEGDMVDLAEGLSDTVKEAIDDVLPAAVEMAVAQAVIEAVEIPAAVTEAIKAAVEEAVAPITAKMSDMEARLPKTKDVKPDDQKEGESDEDYAERKKKEADEKAKGGKADDSAEWTDARSRAELLVPGIRLPTRDAAAAPATRADALCGFRRSVLAAAYAKTDGKDVIDGVLGGMTADFKAMTCDAATLVFNGAAESMRRSNNTAGQRQRVGVNGLGSTSKVPTPAEINETNAAFWAKK
jgi:hypothetical protein